MSDTVTHQGVRRVTRVRTLGDAVPAFRPFRDDSNDEKVVPKTSDELRADAEKRRDAQPMSTSCGVAGCNWRHTGTAGKCRDAAAAHRATAHPELTGSRTHRKSGMKFKRPGEQVDEAVINEHRRLRLEREEAQRVETINRGRRARGEPLLEEVAAERLGPDGATSSSRPTRKDTRMRRTWSRETLIAELQTVAGELGHTPTSAELGARKLNSLTTAKFLRVHGFESFADLCRAAGLTPNTTGRNGGRPRAAKTLVDVPPALRPDPDPAPTGEPSLAALATELEEARADHERAGLRYATAVAAFKQHDVIRQMNEDGVAA